MTDTATEVPEESQVDASASADTQEPDASEKDAASEPNWKAEARKWEQRAKDNLAKLEAAQPKLSEYDRLVEASKSELERAQEERDRWQTEADRWRTSSVTSRIEALASQDFTFPADAVEKLKDNSYLDAGGVIDEAAIRRDLAAVLDERPNWRRQAEPAKPRVPAPNPGQGSGGGGTPADPRQEFAAILQGQLQR